MKEHALDYAAAGWSVFPVEPRGKAPLTSNGFLDATTDAATIEAWWTQTPEANIALAVPLDVLVVDVDPRNGGRETLRALRDQGYALGSTRKANTGGGGDHYYFRIPGGAPRLKATLGPGVDLKRGGKGYVLLPPSVTEKPYAWVGAGMLDPMAMLPDWVYDLATKPERQASSEPAREPKPMLPFEDGTAYGTAAMERELARLMATEEGGRNEALNRAAFALGQLAAGGELRAERARDRLTLVAERIGLGHFEAAGTIQSGFEAGLQEPRSAPETEAPVTDTAAALRGLRDAPTAGNDHFWLDWTQEFALPEFYLSPILPKNAYVLVYGPTQAAKSMVWLSLGAEASRRGYDVSYYSFENPPNVDADRLKRTQPDPAHFRLTNEAVDFGDPLQVDELVGREMGRDLVILDTYSHAMGGDFGGDHNAKAIAFARVIRACMRYTGATFVVIDHTGFGERRDDPRDSSAKRQQVDVAVLMEERTAWKGPGHPAEFRMENKKYARFSNPFDLEGKVRDGEVVDDLGRTRLVLDWEPGSHAQVQWK